MGENLDEQEVQGRRSPDAAHSRLAADERALEQRVQAVLADGLSTPRVTDALERVMRETVWMQCTSCNDLNYRTEIKVAGGVQKIELKKYCPRERSHKMHKIKRK